MKLIQIQFADDDEIVAFYVASFTAARDLIDQYQERGNIISSVTIDGQQFHLSNKKRWGQQ